MTRWADVESPWRAALERRVRPGRRDAARRKPHRARRGGRAGRPRLGIALNAHVRRARTAFSGPLEDDVGLFAAAIHVDFFVRARPDGHVVAAYEEHAPAAAAAGRALGRLGLHDMAAAGTPPAEAFDAAVPSLH